MTWPTPQPLIECDACGETLEEGVKHHCPHGGNEVWFEWEHA